MSHRRPSPRILIAALALLAIAPAARAQHLDDIYWSPSFDAPAFDGQIQDFANFGGDLVAAGAFGQSPDSPASAIARWDGKQWRPLGDGVAGSVAALVEFQGSLIAGGVFDVAGADSARNVARWDGLSWHRMGPGLSQVFDLTVVDGELYAAGDFTLNQNLDHFPVARWNGVDWEPLGPLVPGHVFARARKLTEFEGQLTACGRFRREGVVEVGIVLRWDGAEWDTLALGDASSSATSIAVDGSSLVVGGFFTLSPGNAHSPVARWNGTTWTTELLGWDGVPYELKSLSDGLYLAGLLTSGVNRVAVGRVVPNALEQLPAIDGTAYALAEYRDQLYAGGSITSAEFTNGMQTIFHCIRRGATYWEDIGGPGRDGYGLTGSSLAAANAMLVFADQLYVGGSFTTARSGSQWVLSDNVARWTGSSWIGLPGLKGTVNALAWFGGLLVAGGDFTGPGVNNLARWSDGEWLDVGGGTNGPVLTLAVSANTLYVGGEFGMAGTLSVPGLATWNGGTWSRVGTFDPLSVQTIRKLLFHDGGLYAAGSFTKIGGIDVNNIARWDGTNWNAVGVGYPGDVFDLADYRGHLVAGGYLSGSGLSPVWRWLGSSWEPLPGAGFQGGVRTLVVASDELYAGGDFLNLGGPETDIVARWDEIQWLPLGTGLGRSGSDYRSALAFAEFRGSLYVGGAFKTAGGKPSSLFARWDGLADPDPDPAPQQFVVDPSTPNPFADQTRIDYTPASSGAITIQVLDLNGRHVRTLFEGLGGLGRRATTWDGRDDDNRRVPAGVYYVRFVPQTGEPVTRKVVLVP
jgi:trimeric autotransporter adhesin